MPDDLAPDELDDALGTALRHTTDSQTAVDEVIAEGIVPPAPVLEEVVQRAEDVKELAQDSVASERRRTHPGTRPAS